MARLPVPGSDAGTWGSILNTYLQVSLNSDGTLKPIPQTKITGLATVAKTGSYSDLLNKPAIPAAYTDEQAQDAAAAMLTGGTSSGISFSYDDTNNVINTSVTPGAVADATTSSKGAIQLAGDLGGTASAPTVPGLASKAADNTVVHLAGTETVSGAKTFTGTLTVPAPVNATDAATKKYVDSISVNGGVADATTSTKGVIQLAGDLAGTAAAPTVPSKASIAKRTVYVLDMPNPLASAIGDGTFHQLSERFATLTDAQAVFPRALALTESIDRHALQLALDNYDVVDYGHKNLIIDFPVFTSDPTTARGLGYQKLYGTGWLVHDSGVPAHPVLRSGNSRNIANDSTPQPSEAPYCPYLDITVKVDGNNAHVTGDKATIYMAATSNSIFNVIVKNPRGCGFYTAGVQGLYTYGQTLKYLEVYGSTSLYAARVSNYNRKVSYDNIYTHDNAQHGLYLDASDAPLGLIRSSFNGGDGVWIHNVFGLSGGVIRSTENGGNGVRMSGVTSSSIDTISASNNGTSGAANSADLYWDASNISYGVSYSTTVKNAILGPTHWLSVGGTEKWAQYFEDGVNTDIEVNVRYIAAGSSGFSRMPATVGTLTVRESKPGSSDVGYPAGGAPKLAGLGDVAITGTPSDGQILKYNASSSKWQLGVDNGGTGGSTSLSALTDVTISGTPTDGQVLKYNATAAKWEPAVDNVGTGSGSTTLAGLSDVSVTAPTDGQTLIYSASTGKWTAVTASSTGAGGPVSAYTVTSGMWWQSASAATSTLAMSAGTMYLIPLEFPAAQSMQAFAINVSSAVSGATIRAGLYPQGINGLPNLSALIGDFGTVAASTTGVKVISNLSVPVPLGRAWAAVVAQGGNPTIQTTSAGSGLSFPLPMSINPPVSGNAYQMLAVTGVTGALPTSGTITVGAGTTIKVWFQAS